MANKRQGQGANDAIEEGETDRELRALERVRAAKEADTGDSLWRVYVMRIAGPNKPNDGKEVRIKETGLDDLDNLTDILRSEFGDGTYRTRVRRDNRNVEQWDVQIELSPMERAAFKRRVMALEGGALALPAPAAPAPASDGSEIARVIGESMRYQADMMREMFTQIRGPATDPMDGFAKTMAAFASFQAALPRSEATTGLSMFEKGMQFAEKMIDKGGDAREAPVTLLGLFREAIANPDIGAAIKTMAQNSAQPRQQMRRQIGARPGMRAAQPAAAVRPAAPPQPAPAPAPAKSQEDQAIEYLLGQASIGAEPALVANTALQLIPADKLDLLDKLEEQEAVQMLVGFYPKVAAYRDWFAALIRAMYEPEQGTHAAAEPEPDNATPTPSDTGGG